MKKLKNCLVAHTIKKDQVIIPYKGIRAIKIEEVVSKIYKVSIYVGQSSEPCVDLEYLSVTVEDLDAYFEWVAGDSNFDI